jgi:hypothetical protein
MNNNDDLAREIRAIQQSTWVLAGEIRKARKAAEQTRMLALTMFAHQYQAWLDGGSAGPEPVFGADAGGGAGAPPTLPPRGGSFPPGQPRQPRLPVIDQELMEQIKDTLALSGAGTYDRQVNAQMRQMGAGLTIAGWSLGAVVAFFLLICLIAWASTSGHGSSTYSRGSAYSTPSPEVQSSGTPEDAIHDGRAVQDEGGDKKGLSWDDHGHHFDVIPDKGGVDLFIDNKLEKRFTGKGAAVIYADHTYGSQAGKPIVAPRAIRP